MLFLFSSGRYGSLRGELGKLAGETDLSRRLETGRGGISGSFDTPCAAACCFTGRGGMLGGACVAMIAEIQDYENL